MKEQFTYNGHDYKRGDKIRIVSTLLVEYTEKMKMLERFIQSLVGQNPMNVMKDNESKLKKQKVLREDL